jgi:hypothetical protein
VVPAVSVEIRIVCVCGCLYVCMYEYVPV